MKKRRIAIALCFTLFTAFSLSGCDKKVQPENKILADNLADDITPHPISSDALSADDMLHDTISATDFSVRLFHGSMKENQNTDFTIFCPYGTCHDSKRCRWRDTFPDGGHIWSFCR